MPIPPKELSVFDAEHLLPKNAKNVKELRDYLTAEQKDQVKAQFPKDVARLGEFRKVVGTALKVMINDSLPGAEDVMTREEPKTHEDKESGLSWTSGYLTRKGLGEAVPMTFLKGKDFNGTIVVWVHPSGVSSLSKAHKPIPAAQELLKQDCGILAIDAFGTGAFESAKLPTADKNYAGFTYGYNRTLLANRVHDILTAVAYARKQNGTKKVNLVGFDKAGPWVVLARGLCGDKVAKTAADMNQFRFQNILSMQDEMMQPGALKYGGLAALTALCAPAPLYLHNMQGVDSDGWIQAAYQAAGQADRLYQSAKKTPVDQVVTWLTQ
jgi:hypothetical protein